MVPAGGGDGPRAPIECGPSPRLLARGSPLRPPAQPQPGVGSGLASSFPRGSGARRCVKAGSESLVKPIAPLSTFCPGDPELPGKASTLRREPGRQDCVRAGGGRSRQDTGPPPCAHPLSSPRLDPFEDPEARGVWETHLQATVKATRVSPRQAYHTPESSGSRAEVVFLRGCGAGLPSGPHEAPSTRGVGLLLLPITSRVPTVTVGDARVQPDLGPHSVHARR